ncbi:hypothetical protein [Streptomyces sp. NPDC047061]|uniref:hypothetical protein n=1 Tax=Streptomyces sp. NPDC047061 TaxID=3154605 RepID=UPI0033CA68B1
MAVAFGVLDGLGAAEVAAAVVVVVRGLGDAVVLGVGAAVRTMCRRGVAFGLCTVVFLAPAAARGVFAAFAEALKVFVALGTADVVADGSAAGLVAFQGRPQLASFHQPFVVVFSALSDRCPPLSGQLVQAMAADGMPTAPKATAAMTIRR